MALLLAFPSFLNLIFIFYSKIRYYIFILINICHIANKYNNCDFKDNKNSFDYYKNNKEKKMIN